MNGENVRTDGGAVAGSDDVTVPAMVQRKKVRLATGSSVTIRRISRTDKSDLLGIARVRDGDLYSMSIYAQLVTRRAICEIAGAVDPETGEPIKISKEGPFLLAERAIINVMTDAEQKQINDFALEFAGEVIVGK